MGFGVIKLATTDHGALWSGQAPAKIGDGAVGRQPVKYQLFGIGQGKAVDRELAGQVDGAVRHLADRQRGLLVGVLLQNIEAVVEAWKAIRQGPYAALHDHRVGAGHRGNKVFEVVACVEPAKSHHLLPTRIEQPPADPVRVVRYQRTDIKKERHAGRGLKLVGIGFIGRVQRGTHRRAQCHHGGVREVEDAEGVVSGSRAVGSNTDLVGTGN